MEKFFLNFFFIVAHVQLWALDIGISISKNDAQYI
jgi:hypothetical protein